MAIRDFESVDYGRDIDDTDEHDMLNGPSLFKSALYKSFGSLIFKAKRVKLAYDSDRQAAAEAPKEVAIEQELQVMVAGPGNELPVADHSDLVHIERRNELFAQGELQLIENTIHNGLGSTRFLGSLLHRLDD